MFRITFLSTRYFSHEKTIRITELKVSKYGFNTGPYFPMLGMNTDIYSLNFRIQSEFGKIRTGKISVFGHFSRCEFVNFIEKYE